MKLMCIGYRPVDRTKKDNVVEHGNRVSFAYDTKDHGYVDAVSVFVPAADNIQLIIGNFYNIERDYNGFLHICPEVDYSAL